MGGLQDILVAGIKGEGGISGSDVIFMSGLCQLSKWHRVFIIGFYQFRYQ